MDPVEKTRPANVYPVGEEEIKLFPKYEKIWKEIFGLRKEPLHGRSLRERKKALNSM